MHYLWFFTIFVLISILKFSLNIIFLLNNFILLISCFKGTNFYFIYIFLYINTKYFTNMKKFYKFCLIQFDFVILNLCFKSFDETARTNAVFWSKSEMVSLCFIIFNMPLIVQILVWKLENKTLKCLFCTCCYKQSQLCF